MLSYPARCGFFAPKGTPKEIIGRLKVAAVEALAVPAVDPVSPIWHWRFSCANGGHRRCSARW